MGGDGPAGLRVLAAIRTLLGNAGVAFVEKQHEPTFTSEQSAAARGEPLSAGAKALLVTGDGRWALFVIPADRKLDSAAARQALIARKIRFATAGELLERTGLVPGSVPPFGRPVLDVDLFVDPAVRQSPKVAFNAGSLTTSIVLAAADYARVCNATWLPVSK